MGQLISRKVLTRTMCWTLPVACMLAPLAAGTEYCLGFSPRSFILQYAGGYPMVGTHFSSAILLAALLTILFDGDGRLDSSLNTHRCLLGYVISSVVDCCSKLLCPWVFHLCVYGLHAILVSTEKLAEIVSLAFLLLCGIERLRLVAGSDIDLITVKCSCAICIACGVLALAAYHLLHNRPLNLGFTIAAGSSFVAAQAWICLRTLTITKEAALQTGQTLSAARWARWGAGASVASMTTTLAWGILTTVYDDRIPSLVISYEIILLIDRWSDLALACVCAGLIGPHKNRELELTELGEWIRVRRERQILEAMREAARAISGPSLLLAALFEGADPDELLVSALVRFRCISWDVLKQHPDIITKGGTLDVVGPGNEDLYNLSTPCKFSQCDAFLSHSWRDDGDLKWNAISRWCEGFQQQHHRAPQLWLDKVCIEQTNIRQDLQCLPLFLASCNNLVVCCGQSYTRRLWCCVELFVYVRMLAEDETRHLPVVLPLCSSDEESSCLKEAWQSFDAAQCECFVEEDKMRIMGVIESTPQGLSALSAFIRDQGELMQDCAEERSRSEGTTSERGGATLESEYNVDDDDSTYSI